ncbi:MAG: polysulfide reductase NrfD [Actinomycetota bacterium]|nr:polysulfide reductase NrfD [Actinomycetota bacterium]
MEMAPTYYWNWLLALEMFSGGMAGAAFFIGAMAEFFGHGRLRRITELGSEMVLPLTALSFLALLLDLPLQRVFFFWRFLIFKPISSMSQGVWLLISFTLVAGVIVPAILLAGGSPVFLYLKKREELGRSLSFLQGKEGLRKFLSFIGMLLGVGVMGYSGVVLADKSVPLWSASIFLPATWVAASFTSGLAAIRLILILRGERGEAAEIAVSKALKISIFGMAAAIVVFLVASGSHAGALLWSGWAILFWIGVVGVGIVAPVFLEATRKEKELTSTILVLIGVFFYRLVILYGG